MRKAYVLVMLALSLCQGCYIAKINGTEKLVEIGKQQERIAITRVDAIVPKLEVRGGACEFSLTAHGGFISSCRQQYEVHKVGNQYMAVGLFPGFDYFCEAQAFRRGSSYYQGSFFYPIVVGIANCYAGIPTIYTVFESMDGGVAKKTQSNKFDFSIGAATGIVGTYKYESVPYDVNTGRITQKEKFCDVNSLRLKGYRIIIGQQEYEDVNGVVNIPFVPKDDIVTFRLLDVPANIDGAWRDICKPVLQRDYVVHVGK